MHQPSDESLLDEKRDTEPVERPNELLAGIAADTWQAYNAMEATKRRHFELLERLESRRQESNIAPSALEKQRLAGLLQDHDEQVRRFTTANQALRLQDAAAHLALFDYIGIINEALEDAAPKAH